jgi:DNA-binding NarL/FixJ family response regulator
VNGPQVVRALRQPCILLGLDAEHAAALAVPDAQALQSALGLLDAMLERIDVELGGEPERLAPATRDRVGELASRGLTDPEIAAALGLSPSAVRSARRRGGIAPGAPYARVRTGWQQRIGEAHARGLTTPEIAEATGYTVRTVQQRLAELGLKAHRRP